jgi:hypothetical protein
MRGAVKHDFVLRTHAFNSLSSQDFTRFLIWMQLNVVDRLHDANDLQYLE